MLGAILGDIVGSPYEFDRAIKEKISDRCSFFSRSLLMIP